MGQRLIAGAFDVRICRALKRLYLSGAEKRATQETIDLVGMAAKLSGRPIYEVVQMSLEAALLDPKARQKLFKEPKLEILDTILGR